MKSAARHNQRHSVQLPPRNWGMVIFLLLLSACCIWPSRLLWGQEGTQPGTLTREKLMQMGTAVEEDINLIRLHPEVLDNKEFMRYFIALNNCDNANIRRTLDNELDYPKLAQFYRNNAEEIVSGLPNYVSVALYGGARSIHDDRVLLNSVGLGEYDVSKGAFPFIFHAGLQEYRSSGPDSSSSGAPASSPGDILLGSLFHRKHGSQGNAGNPGGEANQHHILQLEGAFTGDAIRENFYQTCQAASSIVAQSGGTFGMLPSKYSINYDPVGFDDLPMSEADARKYIDGHSPTDRGVYLVIDVTLLNDPPQLEESRQSGVSSVIFSGHIAKVSVIDKRTGANLGNLVDDHMVPDVMGAPSDSKPAPPQAPEATIFMSHLTPPVEGPRQFHYTTLRKQHANYLYSIDVAVQVRMVNDLCKWHLAGDQLHNVDALLRDAQSDPGGRKELAYRADLIQKGIDSLGPENYCRNFQMRSQYEQLLNSLWPIGRVANPDAFW